ncbi:MAG: hypothetical protein JW959_07325 [Pirellulales bacterium]|nr:hypothetical protein [Pirellulales bacterium]
MLFFTRRTILLLAFLPLAGCKPLAVQHGKSPLTAPQMFSDSVVLEMFFIRCPFGDPTVNEKLWEDIDEQQFAPDLRRRLARNGFRVGVVEGQIPVALSKLLELDARPPRDDESTGMKVDDFREEPRVVHRRLQIRPDHRGEIVASGVYERLPVLLCESGRLSGKTYDQAQGIFEVKWFPLPDGEARLELVPELHYGQARQRWIGKQGMIRLDAGRPKEVYEEMTLSARLAPGGMLVLGSLSNRPGSLGHHFFTEGDGRLDQKLLIVRLAQTQRVGLFNPLEPL